MKNTDPIAIVAAKRTPIGHFNGVFKNTASPTLGACVLSDILETLPISQDMIDEVIMGCVLSAGLGQAPARQAALEANLSMQTPCTTINKMCGSGMKAVMLGADALSAGSANIIITGGMENMTRAPYLLPGARFGYRMGPQTIQDHMLLDGLTDAYDHSRSMGKIAELCAKKFDISRNAQDDFAIASIERAIQATNKGFFKTEIVPITVREKDNETVIIEDEGIQKAKPEKIPHLKPAFEKNGTITAANASSISDGAAALMMMKSSTAENLNMQPLCIIHGYVSAATEPQWFTTAPITAVKKLLAKLNWTVDDVDLFEINEAFAVVALAAMQALNIPHDKINIHGGACILGHPIGASGARILVTLIHALQQTGKKRGIAALCIGGGEATAIAIEMR